MPESPCTEVALPLSALPQSYLPGFAHFKRRNPKIFPKRCYLPAAFREKSCHAEEALQFPSLIYIINHCMFPKFLCCPHAPKVLQTAAIAGSATHSTISRRLFENEPRLVPADFALIFSGPTLYWRQSPPVSPADASNPRLSMPTLFKRQIPDLIDFVPAIPSFYRRPIRRRPVGKQAVMKNLAPRIQWL